MRHELLAALCLVLVLEGVFLFAAPRFWQRMADEARQLGPRRLRIVGAVLMLLGVVLLKLVSG